MNVWCFSGRVGADAELRTTQSGEKVLNFRVANDIGFGDRKTTQWVDCQYWGKRAKAVSSYVRKGDKITVSGEVKLEEFQRRDGTPGSKLAVRVNDLDLAARANPVRIPRNHRIQQAIDEAHYWMASGYSSSGSAARSMTTLAPEPRATSSPWPRMPKPVTSVMAWTAGSSARSAPTLFSSVVEAIISAMPASSSADFLIAAE